MANKSRHVEHDGVRWRVLDTTIVDERPAFNLARNVVRREAGRCINKELRLVAFESDCTPWTVNKRSIREGRFILEQVLTGGRSAITLREANGRRRPVTLERLYIWVAEAMALRARETKRRRK